MIASSYVGWTVAGCAPGVACRSRRKQGQGQRWRGRRSAAAGEALESLAARRVQVGDLSREMAQRDVAERMDQRLHLRLRTQTRVALPRVRRGVVVRLAIPAARQESFPVQPAEDGH